MRFLQKTRPRRAAGLLAMLLFTGLLTALLAGCAGPGGSAPVIVGGGGSSAAQDAAGSDAAVPDGPDTPDPPAAPATGSDAYWVTDAAGKDLDLAATPWGRKYPFLVENQRQLLKAIRANGGDAARESALLTGWVLWQVPEGSIVPLGSPLTCFLGYTSEGEPDPDGPQLTLTVTEAELGPETSLTAEQLTMAYRPLAEGERYLTVQLTAGNTGGETAEFYLNSLTPCLLVEGQMAETGEGLSEMMAAAGTGQPQSGKDFYHCTLAPGQTQAYTVVFFADARLALEDLYLLMNTQGVSLINQALPGADPAERILALPFLALA